MSISPMQKALKEVENNWVERCKYRAQTNYIANANQRKKTQADDRRQKVKRENEVRAKLVELGIDGELDALGMLQAALAIMENNGANNE